MIIIGCTDEQVKKMAAAAINASRPVGMGFMHYKAETRVKPEDLEIREDYAGSSLSIDYYEGRMVKFHARKTEHGWMFNPDEISSDYQSWIRDYPSYRDLFEAVAKD